MPSRCRRARDTSEEDAQGNRKRQNTTLAYIAPRRQPSACMVNGARFGDGHAHIIKLYGPPRGPRARPNFPRCWRRRVRRKGQAAFQIIMPIQNVIRPSVNIFGGIMKCDVMGRPRWLLRLKKVGLKVPLVVRLRGKGTNVEERQADNQ